MVLLIPAGVFFFSLSTFCCEKSLELPKEMMATHETVHPTIKVISTLKKLCLKKLAAQSPAFLSKVGNDTLRQLFEEEYRYQNAVAGFALFGKSYEPNASTFSLPHTIMSADKKYFFEFDENIIHVHRVVNNGLEFMQNIHGTLIALSIDNNYLLCKGLNDYFFIEMQSWKEVARYEGPFNKDKDLLVLDRNEQCYVITDCITKKRLNNYDGLEYKYEADARKLAAINPDHYIFTIRNQGIQLKHLLWGDRCTKDGYETIIFPQSLTFSDDRSCALMETTFSTSTQDSKKVFLCQYEKHEKLTLPVLGMYDKFVPSDGVALCPQGRFAAIAWSRYVFVRDFSNFGNSPTEPGIVAEIDTGYCGTPTLVAISPDGRFVLSALYHNYQNKGYVESAGLETIEPTTLKDPRGLEYCKVVLTDVKASKKGARDIASFVLIAKGKFFRHIGFFDEGRKFFVCSDKFYVYNILHFIPHGGIVAPGQAEYPALTLLTSLIKSIEARQDYQHRTYYAQKKMTRAFAKPFLDGQISELCEEMQRLKSVIETNVCDPQVKDHLLECLHLQNIQSFKTHFQIIRLIEECMAWGDEEAAERKKNSACNNPS